MIDILALNNNWNIICFNFLDKFDRTIIRYYQTSLIYLNYLYFPYLYIYFSFSFS